MTSGIHSRPGGVELDDSTIGVALSGGGVRAALFSAGALKAILRYAVECEKKMTVSGVSGSALLALELAWSRAPTDEEALEAAIDRITNYAYWPRRRWWLVVAAVLLALSTTATVMQDPKASGLGLVAAVGLAVIATAIMFVSLFRSQGVFYREQKVGWRQLPIYSAKPDQFPLDSSRLLSLENVVFNSTSLSDGAYVSFDRSALPSDTPVHQIAEASAAFPGVFLPRRLADHDETFADGGVYDNTGLTYFRRVSRRPKLVVAVDAGVSSGAPKGIPYSHLLSVMNHAPWAIGILLVAVFGGAIIGALLNATWLSTLLTVIVLFGVIAMFVIVIPMAILSGLWTDLRWFGRGWPITVRVASDLHLEVFDLDHSALGGKVLSVKLEDGRDAPRAKTQLWRLPELVAQQLVEEGQRRADETLRSLP